MVILGVDPGYATTGFGLIRAERGTYALLRYGTVTTPADDAADAIAIALCHARSSTSQLARLMGGKP